jgi:acyl-lipid omega-6 desaturase (Delta-12 desaturase)
LWSKGNDIPKVRVPADGSLLHDRARLERIFVGAPAPITVQPGSGSPVVEAGVGQVRTRRQIAADYARPVMRRSIVQITTTALLFWGVMMAILAGLDHELWAAAALVPVASLLLVRLFAIQHDCGHYAFLASRRANDVLGTVIGIVTLTPYTSWRKSHALHHANSGNLDRRGVGDITTLTVREYRISSSRRRLAYRLYRHPLVLFVLGPAWQFFVRHRLPLRGTMRDRGAWMSSCGSNFGIVALLAAGGLAVGWEPLLLGWLPMMLLAAGIGVWLFYVQHQFDRTYWEKPGTWDFEAAAVNGCSLYDLPRFLHWATGHLGFHHIHHLSSRIPNYRLRECFERHSELRDVTRLTLLESLRAARLALWDESHRRLVSFAEARFA